MPYFLNHSGNEMGETKREERGRRGKEKIGKGMRNERCEARRGNGKTGKKGGGMEREKREGSVRGGRKAYDRVKASYIRFSFILQTAARI